MQKVSYQIFIVVDFECLWTEGIAIVAAESGNKALEILEKDADVYGKYIGFKDGSEFRLRKKGYVQETYFHSEIEGVIYSDAWRQKLYSKCRGSCQ